MDFIVSRGILLANIAHIRRIRAVRHPFSRCSWRSLLHHAVHLLERETLSFRNEHVGVDETEEAKRAPEEEHFGTEIGVAAAVADEVGRNNSDNLEKELVQFSEFQVSRTYAVPQQVGRGGQSNTTRTNGQWENLANKHPGAWAPCRS
jgi:hypothetical protein